MHEGAYRFIAAMVTRLQPRRSVVELGARTVPGNWPYSGPVRPLFAGADYLGVDIMEGPNVDVVANAATWPAAGYPRVDTVVCCETLEHTPEAEEICATAYRLLKRGGVFLVTAAGDGRAPHSAVDGGPLRPVEADGELEFYRNVTRTQLTGWLARFGFTMIDTATPGDIYGLAVRVR